MQELLNLLNETLDYLEHHGKNPSDVYWVGSRDGKYAIFWDQFEAIAKDVDYDADPGSQEVARDLVVVGDIWWLERREYDGAEGWDFKCRPITANEPEPFNKLCSRQIEEHCMWDSIEEMKEKK